MNLTDRHPRQIPSLANQGDKAYLHYQNLIEEETRVHCRVFVKTGCIVIQTKTPADFYLARSVIKGRTVLPITRDLEDLA